MIFIKRSVEIREHEICGFRDRKKKKHDRSDLFCSHIPLILKKKRKFCNYLIFPLGGNFKKRHFSEKNV